jgi:hypothetical protein
LPSLLNHLRLPPQETPSIIISAALESSLYSLRADPTENTLSSVIAQQYFDCTECTEFFWTFSIVLYSKKHDVSETGSSGQDDGKSPEKFCAFCTTYTIDRILSSLPVL